MRRRLTASYLMLLMLVLAALEVPLGVALASRETQRMVADRLADAIRFASLAEPALRTGDTGDLAFELDRYSEVYGIETRVVDQDGECVLRAPEPAPPALERRAQVRAGTTGTGPRPSATPGGARPSPAVTQGPSAREPTDRPSIDAAVTRQSRKALAGQQASDDGTVWPWRTDPVVVAVPVGSGGENVGAVVIVSPVQRSARAVGVLWGALAVGGLLVLTVGIAATRLFARWTLRPVAELDAAVNHIGAGNYQVRVPDHLGPPELRHLANAFNRMTVTVAGLLERQRRFVSDASHQLRNPLTALRLHVEELSGDVTGPEAAVGQRLALEEIERLGQVLDSLLALARADSGQPAVVAVDAGACASARVDTWRPLAERRGIRLTYRPPSRPAVGYAVATALDQVLDTLIDNAVKFCGPGCSVTVMAFPTGRDGTGREDRIAVHVIDDGPGLTADQRVRAMERFWRGPGAHGVDGSGLGLPIAAVLIEASGGRLDLLPGVPRGLDVRVRLPAAPDQTLTDR